MMLSAVEAPASSPHPDTFPGRLRGEGPFLVAALLVLAIMACNVLLGLPSGTVNDFEEGRYGVSAYEMQQQHSFLVTVYGGQRELWALKPPLGYWMMAASYALLGGSIFAMRLPSALCALATVALTMVWARRWFSARLAIVAGLIVATAYGFLSHHGARSGDFDSALTLLLLVIATQVPKLDDSPWRVVPLALLFAAAFLLKSFAILPMLVVATAHAFWSGGWRRQRTVPLLLAGTLFCAVVGVWVALRWQVEHSPDFFLRMIREDLVDRSTSIVDRSTSSPWSYVAALFDRFAPWPLWMLAAGGVFWASRASFTKGAARQLLVLWIGVPLVLYSLVRTQHHWYLDPIVPALAVVAAGSALLLVDRAGRWRTLAFAGLVILPLAACEGRVLARVLFVDRMEPEQRFLVALSPRSTGCTELVTTFRLLYSERFLLEVSDGFRVDEPGFASAVAQGPPEAVGSKCLLVGKSSWRQPPPPPADRLPDPRFLIAQSDRYALYRAAALRSAER